MTLSIVIPTLNNEDTISGCLSFIEKQTYAKNDYEIIIADGGSTDKTLTISKSYGCRIIHNPKKLAEYGVSLGIEHAKGGIVIIFACDNEPSNNEYLTRITKPFFEDQLIVLSYPKQDSGKKDTFISKYINTFTDPVSHFVYWNGSNTRTFHDMYRVKEKTSDYTVFDFSASPDFPLIALAQGTAVRKDMYLRYKKEGDDILPVIAMIQDNHLCAYVEHAVVFHHTVSSLSQFVKKQRWAFRNFLLKKGYGAHTYGTYFSSSRTIRKMIWPFYAASIVGPVLVGLYEFIFTGKKEWLYHPFLTYVVFYCLVTEFFRVIICKDTENIKRT